MRVCLKHHTVLSYISFFLQHVPQFPKTMLIAIMTLIWSSRQKHLFLFHPENINTQKGNFPFHHQIYRLIWTQTLPFLLLLEINFPSFSLTPALHWYNGSLLFIQGLFPTIIPSLFSSIISFSLCTKSFSWAENNCYGLNCVPQKKICWSSNPQNVTLFRNKAIADRIS